MKLVDSVVGDSLAEPRAHTLRAGEVVLFGRGEAKEPGRRNEDAVAVLEGTCGRLLLALADGVGGAAQGGLASATAIEALVATAAAAGDGGEMRAVVLDAIETANAALLGSGAGAVTTLVVAEIEGKNVRPYHIGDSALLLTGQRGAVKLQTVPHSPVGYGLEAGLLDEHEAMVHEERHLISNALGAPDMRVELGSRATLAPRDTLILASDGVWDNLYATEVVEIVRKGPLMRAAEELVRLSELRMTDADPTVPGKPDDLSFLLFRPRRESRVETAAPPS